MQRRLSLASIIVLAACGGDDGASGPTVAFELDTPLAAETFWNLPFPSDLRLTADGTIDLAGFPNPRNLPLVNDLLKSAGERRGFPVMPIGFVKFTADTPAHVITDVMPASAESPALLVDIDPDSDEHGTLYPVVAQTLPADAFVPDGLVALAPRPGAVLRAHTRYAFVLRSAFARGVAAPAQFTQLVKHASGNAAATELYAPLWDTLAELAVPTDDVIVATVFTTGDEVQLLRDRSELVRAQQHATIGNLALDTVHGANHPEVCVLVGTVTVPQFQKGEAPFSSDGRFDLASDGAPVVQGTMEIPLRITIPHGAMPVGGWPLWQYVHGSGGSSFDLVDEGPNTTLDSGPMAGEGPGVVVGRRGIAAASTAMPVNPERLPGASDIAYLNFNNLAAMPYTFQQGVLEQRLLTDALLALHIPSATLAACGATLPTGETDHHFAANKLLLGGHSMGGMYTNMIGAVEPRFGAITPFGAGGFWNMMILDTEAVAGARGLLAGILGVDGDTLTFAHPALAVLALGWEIAEPVASMSRIARRPLAGFPVRHVYQPIGEGDRYFPNPVFDAAALSYGNRQAGEVVWQGTQDALATDHLDGIMAYPVKANRGGATTNVVVQYSDGGLVDAHQIYRQLPAVRYQYGCFLASYLRDGVPTVPAPAASESAVCP